MKTEQIKAGKVTVGQHVVGQNWAHEAVLKTVRSATEPRTLNNGKIVVSFSYGYGMGGTFYVDQLVTVWVP